MNKSKMIIAMTMAAILAVGSQPDASAREAKGLKVYINPGHGGHEGNDRNVVIPPYQQGDPEGYWESNSNLSKGLQLRDMLEAKGYTVVMSRTTNTEEDDLGLSTIVRLSNESKADVFFSIHSNATGTASRRNFPLMLFRGYDNEPVKPKDKELCIILNKHLLDNQATWWTSTSQNVRGDFTFYPAWNNAGLGVLRGNTVTAMLSEGSFHDYIPETYRLMNEEFCWLEAWHFRKCVDEFFDVDGEDVGVVCGRLNDTRVPRDGDFIMFGDDKLATIQNATVELLDADGKVVQTYTTESKHPNGIYLFKDVKPGIYRVRASAETHMPVTSDELTVTADQATYCNMRMAKVRNTPPAIEWYSPVWKDGDDALLCNTPVIVQFNWDMDLEATQAAFSIEPAVEGTFTWEDLNHRLVFTPVKAYDTNTRYTVTIGTGAKHGGGVAMEKPCTFSFTTTDRNFMEILGSFPKQDEQVHFHSAAVEFRFDKLPNVTPILRQITCTDSKGNAVPFNKRNMTNSKPGAAYGFFRLPFLRDLTVGETYHLQLSGEVADKDGITIQNPVDINFTVVDAKTESTGKNVVETMDDSTPYTCDTESSSNVTDATVKTDKSDKLHGDASTAFTYTFADSEGGEIRWNRAAADSDIIVKPGETIGIHVNGDLTNNEVYLEFTSDVSTLYTHVCDLDFLGWRHFDVPVAAEGNARFTGVKLVQKESQMSHAGTFKIDEIVAGTDSGVNDIVADDATVTVYPNPASEYLVANAGSLIFSIDLTGLNGAMVAKASGNVLNVSDIHAGVYLCGIETAAGRTIRKVVVQH